MFSRSTLTVVLLMVRSAAAAPLSPEEARDLVGARKSDCIEGGADEQIQCLLRMKFEGDDQARELALRLYARAGHVVGVLPEELFDGGYRGTIRLVPQLPLGAERRHLEFTAGALEEIDTFLTATVKEAEQAVRYRWKPLGLRFFRSIKKRTPAAFAVNWTISYNVNGTLNGSLPVVRALLFHEIFHLNDSGWSERVLSEDYDSIVARCGTRIPCLTPFVPEPLIVKGGTYYSFMPGNGVREYAADLALRYFREQREMMQGRSPARPFKCGPPENARAWDKLVQTFFGGVDRVPVCPRRPSQPVRP